MAVNMDALAEELKTNPVGEDEWDETNIDRGDQGLDTEFVPRETNEEEPADPEVTEPEVTEPEVTEEELAAELEKEKEPEAEEEEAPAAEAEEEPEEEKKGHLVPQGRLNKEIDRRKAFELENIRLRQEIEDGKETADVAANEIQEQMRKLVADEHEAILSGKTEVANDLRMQHSDLQMQLMKQSMAEVQQNATIATKAELVFEDTVKELSAQYPILDPDSETFNNDLLQDVLRDRDAFYNAGTPMADALRRAVKITAAINGLDSPEPELINKEPEKGADDAARAAAAAKKLAAAKQQPPNLRGEPTNAHGEQNLNIEELSEEDFEALPEATIRRLRGDE